MYEAQDDYENDFAVARLRRCDSACGRHDNDLVGLATEPGWHLSASGRHHQRADCPGNGAQLVCADIAVCQRVGTVGDLLAFTT